MRSSEVVDMIGLLSAAFPSRVLAPDTVKVYSRFLVDLPGPVVMRAAERLILSGQFFPSVSDLRRAVADEGKPSAEEAWVLVCACVTEHPYVDTYIWQGDEDLPPAARRAASNIPLDELAKAGPSARAHFMRFYAKEREAEYVESCDRALGAGAEPVALDDGTRSGSTDTTKLLGGGVDELIGVDTKETA